MIIYLTRAYFIANILLLLITYNTNSLKPLLGYGKTTAHTNDNSIIHYIAQWKVPRAWFRHFYAISIITGSALIVQHNQMVTTYKLILILSHSIRRLYETSCIERPSGSEMWIGHYLVGITHYVFLNLSTLDASKDLNQFSSVAVIIFLLAQIVQHMAHRRLASIRARCKPGQYENPKDGLFRWCIAPHYTAEVVLYTALAAFDYPSMTGWLVTLWTIVILGSSALQTNAWGRAKFDDWGHRAVLIPSIY